jgi:hypothetical protein
MIRGRRKSVATALAEVLGRHRETGEAAIAAAFVEACGQRLSRSASFRGVMQDGRLLVVVVDQEWASQFEALADRICAMINARLGRVAAPGLDVRIGSTGRDP